MLDTPNLDSLQRLTKPQLRVQWTTLGVHGDPPHLKPLLIRGIAWHLQRTLHGDLDAESTRLLNAAIRGAPDPTTGKRQNTKKRAGLQLRTGTTLVRTWRGRTHEVAVLDDGKAFRYRDAEYASLSEIAREITGARWSGPRFLGLKKLKGAA